MSKKTHYYYHCENLKEIECAISLIERNLRDAISRNSDNEISIFTNLLSYLISCWSEIRICKVIEEPNSFSSHEKQLVIKSSSLIEKWKTALLIGFCKAYKVTLCNDSNKLILKLPVTAKLRYQSIINILENELNSSIELRNRIAHGQWKYAFTTDMLKISNELTKSLRTDNIVKLQLKQKMFVSLSLLINDLIVSPVTFERDFDKHFAHLCEQRYNFHKRDYNDYKTIMVKKYNNGKLLREKNRLATSIIE